ncbi:MAG: CARDB domain-containing protein [Pyrinomonadaceae bacterium]
MNRSLIQSKLSLFMFAVLALLFFAPVRSVEAQALPGSPLLAISAPSITTGASTATSPGPIPARTPDRPDLIVKEVAFDPSPSRIRVRVFNQGTGASASCYLALQSLVRSDPSLATKQRVWTIPIPALDAGKGFSNVIDVAPLAQTHGPWRATVDRSNTVVESNENNNTLTYPAGNPGPVPPNLSRPDLVIEHFTLTDPAQGQVTIAVTNQGGANSGNCTLRLIVWKPGKFEHEEAKTVFVKVQALHVGQSVMVTAAAGVPIINTKYSLFIDIGEDVKESDENNNRAEGEAGNFKP